MPILWWIWGRWPIRPLQKSCPKPFSCPVSSPSAPVHPMSPPGSSGPRSGAREAPTACRRNSRSWWPETMWSRYSKGFRGSTVKGLVLSFCSVALKLIPSSSSSSRRWRRPSRVVWRCLVTMRTATTPVSPCQGYVLVTLVCTAVRWWWASMTSRTPFPWRSPVSEM